MVNLVTYPGDVVVVTGGCGFVGQSLVRLLLEKYENLAEVIVVDIQMPPKDLQTLMATNKSNAPKVRFVQCDIRDADSLVSVFEGVDIVFHLASLVDTSRCADLKRLHDVNVTGSMNVVAACKKNNIEYLISTSTTEINRGYTPRMNATERSVDAEIRALEDLVMPGYSSTKRLGEEVVLAANNVILSNGKRMRTLALRPPGIYGEYDHTYVTALLQSGKTFFGVLPIFGSMSSKMERVYVGNVAWAHIAAYRKVVADPSVGGTAYHICDGSSSANNFLWTKPVLETQSIKVLPFSIPFFIVYYFYFFLEFFVWLVSPLVDIRLPAERNHLYLCCTTVTYNGNLAKHRLDYKPLYTPKQAFQRSLNYYSNLKL